MIHCEYCGKETTKKRFCSRECMYNSKRKARAACPNCGKPASRAETKFCSMKCRDEYRKKVNEENRVYNTCIVCGAKTLNEKYCNMKCLGEDRKTMDYYHSNLKNEHTWSCEELEYLKENYGYLPIEELCDYYGLSEGAIIATAKRYDFKSARKWTDEEIEIVRSHLDEPEYLVETLKKSPSAIANQIKRVALKDTGYGISPEEICKEIIEELGISTKGKREVPFEQYRMDFLINDVDIEVQGTYFHCDPRFYPNGAINDTQAYMIPKDERRRCYIESKGYKVLYIWEHDLYVNREKCKELIGVAILKSRN